MWNKLRNSTHRNEQGFTLVEILVAIGLFIFVSTAITVSVVMLSNSTSKFSTSSMTQNQAADTVSEMTRDLSSATEFTYADDYRVSFIAAEDNKTYEISYFYWNPSDNYQVSVPAGVNTAELPKDAPAIIQYRRENGSSTGTTKVAVQGYSIYQQDRPLFSYFNKANATMETPVVNEQLKDITRVDYGFLLKIDGRKGMIELASAATPRYAATNIDNGGEVSPTGTCATPTLVGSLTPQTTIANLSWTQVKGANTYTLYRMNDKQKANPMVVAVVNNFSTTTYADNTVAWGEKYQYFVVAGCAVGISDASNVVGLSVTPDQPVIVNFNKTGHKTLTAKLETNTEAGTSNPSKGQTYTVARGFINQVTWTPMNGAEGYKIFRKLPTDSWINAPLLTTIYNGQTDSYNDINKTYGDVYDYMVVAFNTGENGSGGDSVPSAGQKLISPPKASTYSFQAVDSTRSTTTDNYISVTKRADNTDAYRLYSISSLAATTVCPTEQNNKDLINANAFAGNQNLLVDSSVQWGSITCYIIQPFNDAGDGPIAQNADGLIAKQYPAPFMMFNIESTKYQQMNQDMPLPYNAVCWTSFVVEGSGEDGCYTAGFAAPMPIGLFDSSRINPKATNITVGWENSYNAYGGYSFRQQRNATGGIVDQGDASYYIDSNTLKYTGSGTTVVMNNQMPGSYYTYTVTAYSANGLGRTSSKEFVSSPDIPSYTGIAREWRQQTPSLRRRMEIDPAPQRGLSDFSYGQFVGYRGAASATFSTPSNSGFTNWYSEPFYGGGNAGNPDAFIQTYNVLARAGITNYSEEYAGNVWAYRGNPPTNYWTTVPPTFQNYINGNYLRSYAGGVARGTVVEIRMGAAPKPTPTPPDGQNQKPDPSGLDCTTLAEDSELFALAECEPGSGIPAAPQNLIWSNQNGANTTVTWDEYEFAVRYIVIVKSSGGAITTTDILPAKGMPTISYNVTVPYGQSTEITVKTVNDNGTSVASKPVTVMLPNTPTGFSKVAQTADSYTVAWNASNYADYYTVTVIEDGVENIYQTDTLQQVITLNNPNATKVTATVYAFNTHFPAVNETYPTSKPTAVLTLR